MPDSTCTTLNFTDLLLGALGYRDDERVAVCHCKPGGTFRASVMPPDVAPRYVAALDGVDVWFSVNPTAAPAGVDVGRGTAAQTTRLAALVVDLDVKPGGCPDLETAEAVIDDLSALLGARPSAVVHSGHGLQPYWPVDDGDVTDAFTVADAAVLLARFGLLVALVAEKRKAKADNVFDLARVLRAPGTTNHKSDPVPISARPDTGGPLTVDEVTERLDEAGVAEPDLDGGEQLSDPDGWVFAEQTCGYTAALIEGIAADTPAGGRNPWACHQAVRLCCAKRLGCVTEADFERARKLLGRRLAELVTGTEPRRGLRRHEIP